MEKIRITGVPEHFNYPWLKVIESQPFRNDGLELEWVNEPKGSGAMNKALREGETDLAVVLTESFVKDKIEGNPGLMIGLHVASPLIWGIHISGKSSFNELKQLANFPFLISRYGSGSHLMAYVLAKRENWVLKDLKFEVIGDLEGAKKALGQSDTKIFLWEKFTTKPLVDQGIFKRVGELPTPWPCFALVAHPKSLKKNVETIRVLRDLVYEESSRLSKQPNLSKELSDFYNIKEDDIKFWLSQTTWANQAVISKSMVENTMLELMELGLIGEKMDVEKMIFNSLVELV
ncbi:ABC-type nitrate/sulfonate/bicarbonate transport system, substrate-binding protein [Aquiflexum balticum DSM 16537]|uniref:ABC-type nitrate/sulfonate/bicarbonate transport system, substrate-binding protein n=1 Tax=Aquiflexum balticum DSM 16537 TaxID=758820 RepID=A0A1W2HA40_9BACT|nr:substrate-binding domain-containing protein [Aquiflexum balticum]SMD45592.1 ABC-type nitrate/sulfonate/bicarbonate transport system, substrate-binding protein [Aquiflexum balticum DSM 16537]